MDISTIKMIMERTLEGETYIERNLLLFPLLSVDTDPVMLMQLLKIASEYGYGAGSMGFPTDHRSQAMAFIWVDMNFPDKLQECVDVWDDPKQIEKIRRFVTPLAKAIGLGTNEKMSERKGNLLDSARSMGIFIPNSDLQGVMTFKTGYFFNRSYKAMAKEWKSMHFRSARGKVKEFYYAHQSRDLRLDLEQDDVTTLLTTASVTNPKIPEIVTKAFGNGHWHPTMHIGMSLTYTPDKKANSVTMDLKFGTVTGASTTDTPEKLSPHEANILRQALVSALTAVCKPVTFTGMKIAPMTDSTENEVSSRIAKQMLNVPTQMPQQTESQEVK